MVQALPQNKNKKAGLRMNRTVGSLNTVLDAYFFSQLLMIYLQWRNHRIQEYRALISFNRSQSARPSLTKQNEVRLRR